MATIKVCPMCHDVVLQERVAAGIRVDTCPRCHGTWLDRGELEQLARDAPEQPQAAGPPLQGRKRNQGDDDDDDDDDDDRDRRYGRRRKSVKSRWLKLLDEILD